MAVCPVSCRETGKQEQFVTYIGNQKFSVTHPKKTLVLKCQEEAYNLTIDPNIGSLWIDVPCGCTFQDNENITTYPTYRCIDKTITYGRRHLVPAVWSQFQGLTLSSWDSTLPQFDNLHNCLNKNWIEENVKSSSTPVITYFVVINFLLIVSVIFTNAYLYVKLKKKFVYYERHKLNPADKKTFEIGSVKFSKAKTTYTKPKDRPLPEPIQEETDYLDPNEVNIPSTSSATPSSIIQHSSPMMPTSNPVTPTTSTPPSHYVPMNKSQYVPFSKKIIMAQKRALTQKELEYAAEHLSDYDVSDEDKDPYSAGSSDDYAPGSDSGSDSDLEDNVLLPRETLVSETGNDMSDAKENLVNESTIQTISSEGCRILD
ncbi:hypothetical protein RN001_012429 [Aquatica leii]|uniref:Uncharacterized protein n=1 Tax=Aquatica leii TaxID=1421715 RepID=A0AAN7PUE3_9COLE|nr:hypothetical protein RN001_012429 [Aquatica leii]